jgi:DNA helicase II / ATP-dependent DNA helicase PcrA
MQDKLKITQQQLDILNSKSGIKRVIACAGSGKTFVLTKSIIETLREGLCRPDEVLAITFTRNAAENMRQRIKDNLKEKIDFENIDIFTFNSFGNSIISENSLKLSLGKNYKLINISKSWQLIFNVIGSFKFEKIKIGKNLGKFIDDVLKFVWDLKSNLVTVEKFENYLEVCSKVLSNYKSTALRRDEKEIGQYQQELFDIYSKYEELKLANNYVDYHDHIFLPYQLLLKDRDLRLKYQNRYKYIFIDEFQDTDFAQGYLISMLYNPGANSIMIVGDDDQGIYSFRGACVENILNFHNWDVFRGSQTRDYYLTTNFRSGANIINAVSSVIGENKDRFTKDLMPEYAGKYSEVLFFAKNTLREEATEIAKNIKYLINSGMKLKDIAILARRKRFKEITYELQKNNLRYEVVGSKGFFYEPEILFIISWLMAVRDVSDEIYILYLLQSQKYRISDRDIFFLKQDKNIKSSLSSNDIVDYVLNWPQNPYMSELSKERLKEFTEELSFYLNQSQFLKLGELVNLIFQHSGLANELKSCFDRTAKVRIKNVEILIKIAADFEENQVGNNLDSFIIYLKDVAKTDDEDPESFEFTNSNSIKIMSIHAAKGLEFEAVFLPMLWKNDYFLKGSAGSKFKIPAYLRMDRAIYAQKENYTNKDLFQEEIKGMKIEEERRIFYVACSRAKKFLFLSYSNFENLQHSRLENYKEKEILPFLKDILKLKNGYRVINKEAGQLIKTIINDRHEFCSIDIQNLIKTIDNPKKRVNNLLDIDDINSAENLLASNADNQVWLNDKLTDLTDLDKKELKKYVKNIILLEKFPAGIYKGEKITGKNSFSLTELLTYIKCSKLYALRYVYNLPEDFSEKIKLGEKVHKYIEHISTIMLHGSPDSEHLKSPKTASDVLAVMLSNIEEEQARYYLDVFLKSSFFMPEDINSVIMEQLFYWKLDKNYITCKVDRLDKKKDGNFRIIDYKLSKFYPGKENSGYINQLKAYVLGISGIFSILPTSISSYILYLENGKETEHNFTEDELKKFEKNIISAVNGIKKRQFSKSITSNCRQKCSYYKICAF